MRARREQGFVLVTTLWVLAAITLGAAFFAEQVDRARQLARDAQEAAQALTDMENTRAEVLFRLATMDLSIHGLGPDPALSLRLDDRAYRGTGGDVVSLQDQRGLINLNFADREVLARVIGRFGVAAEHRDSLLDALQDFIDLDEFRRLNGAEARQYEERGLPPPMNDWLLAPQQLRAVLGWREQEGLWRSPRFLQLVTTAPVGVFNPNTAPAEVLASLPGSSDEIAELVVRQRRLSPMVSWTMLGELTGQQPRDLESVSWTPGDSIRVTQRARRIPWMLQYSVTLTPASPSAPWQIDYHAKSAAAVPTQDESQLPPLPSRAPTAIAGAAPF